MYIPVRVRVVTLILTVNPWPALLVANTDIAYRLVLLRPVKVILLSVVTFSVINCISLNNLMLYIKTPQASWLKVSHVMLNEFSVISVTRRFGVNGRPMQKKRKLLLNQNTCFDTLHYTHATAYCSRKCKNHLRNHTNCKWLLNRNSYLYRQIMHILIVEASPMTVSTPTELNKTTRVGITHCVVVPFIAAFMESMISTVSFVSLTSGT